MPTYRTPTYYLAPSLVALFNEIDARWPNRSKVHDGWIGDAAHAARASDHNPDYSAGGVVRAIDITRVGVDVDALLLALIRDPRVWYVIFNRRIASRTHGWVWKPYAGASPHTEHIHVSIVRTRAAETNTARWAKLPVATEVPEVITDADAQKIAKAVLAMVEPRLQAYARYVTLHEEQTDSADAQRAADAVVAELDKRTKP